MTTESQRRSRRPARECRSPSSSPRPTPGSGLLVQTVFLVALVALVVAVVAAVAIARDLTGPLEEVTDAAEAVASGDLTKSIEVRRSDEVGRLARAFNHMTDELLTYVTELEGSRDALQGQLRPDSVRRCRRRSISTRWCPSCSRPR